MSEETAAPVHPKGPGTLTEDIYWASQSPTIQALRRMPQGVKKNALINQLRARGILINGPVWILGDGAAWQMTTLTEAGDTWFPALGYPQLEGTGTINPEGPMPPWGIKVSTDAADYPAWGTK